MVLVLKRCPARFALPASCLLAVFSMVSAVPAVAADDGPAVGVGFFQGYGLAAARIEFGPADEGTEYGFERGEPVKAVLRLANPVKSQGTTYSVRICDSFGRQLVNRVFVAPKAAEQLSEIPIEVPVHDVVSQRHILQVAVTPVDGKMQTAERSFIYRLPAGWDDYICGVWQRHNATRIPYLQEMFVTGSQWSGSGVLPPQHFIDHNFWFYLEGTGNWVYSPYHIWMPDKDKTYYYQQVKKAFIADRTNFRNLERNPCLSNHVIQDRIRQQFGNAGRIYRNYRPLYYTVADEPGIANQAAPFDFCFSPYCKAAFREWLQKRYPSLDALNSQWGSSYKDWDEVRGATTDEIFARGDDNFSAWADHEEFMDDVLTGAYAIAGQAVKRSDPAGRLGVGGVQGPSAVGGWDFWKLCNLIPFHCSFAPSKAEKDKGPATWNPERHLIWYLFIHGDRGLIAWDDPESYVNDKGEYDDRARDSKPLYAELTGGIGKLRIASQRTDDPIALYHSQPNLRVHWVLEVRPEGKSWINRGSGSERIDSRYFRLRESWVKLIEDNGLQYKFVAPEQVKAGGLKFYDAATGAGYKVLILPEILAMSAAEAREILDFVAAGGTVIADRMPATFDEHGRKLDASPLADLFGREADGHAILLDRDMLSYYQDRLYPGGREDELKNLVGEYLVRAVGAARATPLVVGADGKPVTGVEATLWTNGQMQMIALHRNPLLRVNELGPQEYQKNDKFEVPVDLVVKAGEARAWYDVRSGRKLDVARQVKVLLKPFEPTILTSLPVEAQPFAAKVDGDSVRITPGQPCAAKAAVYHLAFLGPDGEERLLYRTNVAVPAKGATLPLPLALNDDKGTWTLEVREVATGATQRVLFERHKL
jgi:hypothetical protein